MQKRLILFLSALVLTAAGSNAIYELTLPADVSADQSEVLFQQYCGANVEQISTQIPNPNYQDDLVAGAARKLNTVAPVSFYMYRAVVRSYGFERVVDENFPWEVYEQAAIQSGQNQSFGMKKTYADDGTVSQEYDEATLREKFAYQYKSKKYDPPQWVKGNSHAFLTYLCGEFRDRPTLIQAKLEWVNNMIKLPVAAQERILPENGMDDVWSKLTAESYAYYVTFSRQAFDAKEAELKTDVQLGQYTVDKPVPAFTVCEVNYIMTEYVTNGKQSFPGYEAYMSGYNQYKDMYCTAQDSSGSTAQDYYYDFRGDSNMKPNSPESNGMIWHATSIMGRCRRDLNGRVKVSSVRRGSEWIPLNQNGEGLLTEALCEKYMSRPFANRWNAARAGLATWLARDIQFDDIFADTGSMVHIVPTITPEKWPSDFKTFDGTFSGEDLENYLDLFSLNYDRGWLAADIGINYTFGITGDSVREVDMAYERLRDAVDRHTDWYASGYDDSNIEPERARVISQAYSPFVASSYEMSESDAFTAPGITVNGPVDGRRQWMYVFKVHKSKWYNTDSLARGEKLNFETQWFDETSYGTTHLADTERAWDRLGTPLEGEMDSIIYLHNIQNNNRAIKSSPHPSTYPSVIDDGLGATE